MKIRFLIAFNIGLGFAMGCTTTIDKTKYRATILPSEISFHQNSGLIAVAREMEPAGVITLDDALKAALVRHPGLAASRHEIKAHEASAKQTGMFPNPSLLGEIEEFGGSGDYSGTDFLVSRVGISQEIPLGGQISKRVQAAEAQTDVAVLEYAAQTFALRTAVRKRFLRVYILQEQLKLEKENLTLLEAIRDAVVKRVASGEASPLDEAKVAVQLASSGIAVDRTKRELETAKYVLASSWAGDAPKFSEVMTDYQTIIDLPDETELLKLLESNPAYGILKRKVALSSAHVELARAEAWMDIEVGGGVQHFNETDDHAYFLEVSIPIPFFDRNKGRIEEALQLCNKTRKDREAGLIALKTSLLETAKRLSFAQDAFLTMQNTVMPAVEKAFISVQKAYQVGEQGYLELLEAQRTRLDSRREQLELFAELQELKAELDGLTAGNLS
jgi:cobalt-zinc-cadmium efflux system outer membrane protein